MQEHEPEPKVIPGLDASYTPGSGWCVDPVWAKEQALLSEERKRAKQSNRLNAAGGLPLSEAEAEDPLYHWLA